MSTNNNEHSQSQNVDSESKSQASSPHNNINLTYNNNISNNNNNNVVELGRKEQSPKQPTTVNVKELLTGGGGHHNLKSPNSDHSPSSSVLSTPPSSHRSQESKLYKERNTVVMALIDKISTSDEEGRSKQRMLKHAAKKYASAIESNPNDYDALYNWALVLQESADNVNADTNSSSKDALLEEACNKYDEATQLNPSLHDAYYNWAIAISDRAKLHGRTKEAEELWKHATKNYEKAIQLNWKSPQVLNNWGLALQELSAIAPAREKQTIVKSAISKFRAAIRLQFDFHRATYNLGTVLYGLAEDTSRTGVLVLGNEASSNELYSQAAIYIAAAHALKPSYSVYSSALKLVRSMLPLPYLKVGYLIAPPVGNSRAPHSDWKRFQFVLNHEGLQQIHNDEQKHISGDNKINDRPAIKVEIPDVVSVTVCSDLTLPPGPSICIDTIHGPTYLIADSWEYLEAWIDAIRLVYTIFARGKIDVLAGIITG